MLDAIARNKLNNVMGLERGSEIYRDMCREIGLADIVSANDSLKFGKALIAKGGIYASIGQAIKVQAILVGAVDR